MNNFPDLETRTHMDLKDVHILENVIKIVLFHLFAINHVNFYD